MNATLTIHHHGDVSIKTRDEIPADAVAEPRPKLDRVLLAAVSAQTGHAHQIIAPAADVSVFAVPSANEDTPPRRFLKVSAPVQITGHPDHGAMPLDPGVYELGIAREHDPVEGARLVVD